MHSHQVQVVRGRKVETLFLHFNSDLSGDVIVTNEAGHEVTVPGELFLAMSDYMMRNAVTSWAEEFDFRTFLEKYM